MAGKKSPETKESVIETLIERGNNYGCYEVGTALRANIMKLILASHVTNNDTQMDKFFEVAILDIVNKLSRIAVTPTHIDSWHDICGYATLVENYLKDKALGS